MADKILTLEPSEDSDDNDPSSPSIGAPISTDSPTSMQSNSPVVA